jgi:PAS domain S-box-containing protein
LQASIEQAPEGVFWATSSGLIHHANPRFCELLGYSEGELKSLHICNLLTAWPRSKWPQLWQECREQQAFYCESGLTTKFGDVIAVEINAGLLNFDSEALMCGFVRDSARRKKDAETLMAELKASEQRFRLLYDNAPVMLQACDFETRLFSVNQFWLDTLGYTWDEVIGRQTLEFMTKAARPKVAGEVLPILRQTGSIHDYEYQLVKKSGEVIDVALTAVSDLDENGRILRTLSMILPIPDRKRAERLESQNIYLREELIGEFNKGEIIGTSAAMQAVFKNIEMVAATDATVLLLGETGTGKELVARAIHQRSARKDGVMVKVNCGALPSGLVESELFGHEKGAFTGATTQRKGRFELAHTSTLFLDEVGELPLDTQTRLLRVLQEQELERIGGSETIKVDVRVIAATNRDLGEAVMKGNFRADLFYRLNVFPIRIPPLRERIDDIPRLTHYFVNSFAARFGKKITTINRGTIDKLIAANWPGNVRELANILERAVILCQGDTLRTEHIGLGEGSVGAHDSIPTLEENERRLIRRALEKCNGRLSGANGAANLLGVNRSTLWSRMQKLGINATRQPRE